MSVHSLPWMSIWLLKPCLADKSTDWWTTTNARQTHSRKQRRDKKRKDLDSVSILSLKMNASLCDSNKERDNDSVLLNNGSVFSLSNFSSLLCWSRNSCCRLRVLSICSCLIRALVCSKWCMRVVSDWREEVVLANSGLGANQRTHLQGKNSLRPKYVRGEDGFFRTSTYVFWLKGVQKSL